MQNVSRICTKCKVVKSLECFSDRKHGLFGKNSVCKLCVSERARKARLADYDRRRAVERAYKEKNREKIKQSERNYYYSDLQRERDRKKKYRKEKAEHISALSKARRNTDKYRIKNNDYVKKKYKEDPNFKLRRLLYLRQWCFMKGKGTRAGSAVRDLGCSLKEFKEYIESKFESWMTWENHGKYNPNKKTWNLDHIIPLCKFDLTDREQFLKACHYTNMQPLEAIKNLRKNRF